MPDVERCPFCNSGDRREETWQDKPAYSFSCGTVFYANGEVAWRYFACYSREKEQEERAIREQLAAALAEADRWRKKYEALRAAVEGVADLLDRLRGAFEKARQLHCIDRDPYEDGRSVGWGTAVKWLRKALAEAGGGSQ